MSDLFRALVILCLVLLKALAVITMAIYYLFRQILFGIAMPGHPANVGFEPVFDLGAPDEPTDAQMGKQMNRYEKSEWARYQQAIAAQSVELEEPF